MHTTKLAAAMRFLVLAVLIFATPGVASETARTTARGPESNAPDRGPLPDSHVLARVGEREITVYGYRSDYFLSDATLRPRPDSLGRLQFLRDLIDKEVLGQAALKAGYELAFEDRIEYRGYRNTLLSNLLFSSTLKNIPPVSDDSLRRINGYYNRDLKLRLLYFSTREEAEFTRLQLASGRLIWSVALAKYGVHSKAVTNGVSDWMKFASLPLDVSLPIWGLRVGQISAVIPATSGYHVVQVIQERPGKVMPFSAMRGTLRRQLRDLVAQRQRTAIQDEAKRGLDVVYDSTNVRWAASFFQQSMRVESEGLGGNIVIDPTVPEFTVQDTARTLVTWKGGRLSVGAIVHEYSDIQPVMRPSLNTPERMFAFVDAVMLGPRMTEIAEKRGIDKDSIAVALLARKREGIFVGHMVEDSVLRFVQVTKAEREAYYRAHPVDFTTYPRVRYASLVRTSKGSADSTRWLVEHGANIDSLVALDQKRNVVGSGTNEIASNEPSDYHKLLFEELRPGKATIIGPDKAKLYAVLFEISYDAGHLLPYADMEASIDESVRNIKGDRGLREFIGRLEKRFPVSSHPELVMRIPLTDPTLQTEE